MTDASTAAQRFHAQLGTDYSRPIDVFQIVQDEGIWLASKPLSGGLYGFYLRQGDVTGIVVNSDHPESLQRYTCAHELGHHLLGHGSRLDEPDDVRGPSRTRSNEVAAQAFAGAFLMPLQAVNRVLRRLGLKDRTLDATGVYAISRELDVSFSAAAWQLVALGKISVYSAERWVQEGAAAAKNLMRPGEPPEGDNRAALYIVDESADEVPILCRPGDELRVRLTENASTGYVWGPVSSVAAQPRRLGWDGGSNIQPVDDRQDERPGGSDVNESSTLRLAQRSYREASATEGGRAAGDGAEVARPGHREFVFLADHQGRGAIDFALSRPWEAEQLQTLHIPVHIGPAHILEGFAREQAQAHATRVGMG